MVKEKAKSSHMSSETKDFTTISPSALSLIGLKAHTNIPFAREAASLLSDYLSATTHHPTMDKAMFFKLLIHFENRYRTVDKVLSTLPVHNILEISSGYSFRGLHLCEHQPVHFIDTDLPEVISLKKEITDKLIAGLPRNLQGKLELHPLNVLHEADFNSIIDRFPEGPIAIVNEGLLVYLDPVEKSRLAVIVGNILKKRGGYWITGDVYTQNDVKNKALIPDAKSRKFREDHQIDENKFEDFTKAHQFFTDHHFEITTRVPFAADELSCLELMEDQKDSIIRKLQNSTPSRETWCLKIKH